jgi:hypothetical protein
VIAHTLLGTRRYSSSEQGDLLWCATYHGDQPYAPYRCSASCPSRLHFPPCSDQTRRRETGVSRRWAVVDIARELERYTSCAEAAGRVSVVFVKSAAAGGGGDAAAVVGVAAAAADYAREAVGVEVVSCHFGTVTKMDCPASTHTWECTWLKMAMIGRCQAWLVQHPALREPLMSRRAAGSKTGTQTMVVCAEQARSRRWDRIACWPE